MLRRGLMAAGSGGSSDAMGGLILSHGPLVYFRLGEASGTTARNDGTGPDGAYAGLYTLGNPALRVGGGTSYSPTANNARAAFLSASIPSLSSGLTLGVVGRSASIGGIQPLINRSDAGVGGGTAVWQFRLNGSNLQFEKNVGGYQQVEAAHGLAGGDIFLAMFTYDQSTGAARLYMDGSQIGTTATFATGVNWGGPGGSDIIVGNFFGYNQATAGNRFSDAFVIGACLSDVDIAAIAVAGGF